MNFRVVNISSSLPMCFTHLRLVYLNLVVDKSFKQMDVVCVCQTQSSPIILCAFVTVSKLTTEHFHIHN